MQATLKTFPLEGQYLGKETFEWNEPVWQSATGRTLSFGVS